MEKRTRESLEGGDIRIQTVRLKYKGVLESLHVHSSDHESDSLQSVVVGANMWRSLNDLETIWSLNSSER